MRPIVGSRVASFGGNALISEEQGVLQMTSRGFVEEERNDAANRRPLRYITHHGHRFLINANHQVWPQGGGGYGCDALAAALHLLCLYFVV